MFPAKNRYWDLDQRSECDAECRRSSNLYICPREQELTTENLSSTIWRIIGEFDEERNSVIPNGCYLPVNAIRDAHRGTCRTKYH